jgi:hypothetical protein
MSEKNWTGDGNSIYKTLGASNHTKEERQENDYYATDPKAVELLLTLETFSKDIWEPACGEGHISKILEANNYNIISSDLIDRGYGEGGVDFLKLKNFTWDGDIITNPPYKYGQEFVEKAIKIVAEGHKIAMFLKLQFLEGKARKKLFKKYPPKIIWVSSSRLLCAKNGLFAPIINGKRQKKEGFVSSSAVAYAWFIWEKGFKGQTVVNWFN